MKCVDTVVIGGGILGCFAARNLLRWNISVLLIEKNDDVCMGITRANSAIVYSGCDNKPGSLKAELAIRANRQFDELCKELDVPFSRCGSLAVAVGPCGEQVLRQKYEQGKQNGVPGIRLLTCEEAGKLEPHLKNDVTMALYVPGTGTVNPWQLGIAAYENARQNGCEVWLNTEVTGIRKTEQGYVIGCRDTEVFCRSVINCAGLSADRIQEMLFPPSVRLFPDGAGYLVMDRECPGPEHIVFQEAEDGKGITAIPTVEGNLLLASPKRNQEGEPFSADNRVLEEIKQMTEALLPEVDCRQVIRSFGAVRPNPHRVIKVPVEKKEVQNGETQNRKSRSGIARNENDAEEMTENKVENGSGVTYIPDGKNIGSFSIEHPEDGFFSMIGIKTPGITCANELGLYLAEQITEYLGAEKNLQFDSVRKGIPSVHQMSYELRAALAKEHPEYGEVICRCEDITKGEILEAIRRGAKTAEGVKRRVGTGMGRCQGSRCSQKIERLIKECSGNMISLS